MRVVHLLRKYDPADWGGTETAVMRLFEGLREHDVSSVMYCPRLEQHNTEKSVDGCTLKRFKACLPVWGIPRQVRRQLVAVGGNLMSFDLLPTMWREPDVSVIH